MAEDIEKTDTKKNVATAAATAGKDADVAAEVTAQAAAEKPVLRVRGVRKTFSPGTPLEHEVLRGVDLDLAPGEFACLIGSNGAGKSTLLNAVAGEFLTDAGTIELAGRDITFMPDYRRARTVSRVFQDPMRGTAPGLTVAENVALAYMRSGHRSALHMAMRRSLRTFFHDALASLGFGLEDRMDTKVGLLSGGQRQAVSLLMCTIGSPDLLLLDEHTAALDPLAADRVMELTQRIAAEKHVATIMVTHNMSQALTVGDRTLVMNEGVIVADVSREQRAGMTVRDLLDLYQAKTGSALVSDEVLLGS